LKRGEKGNLAISFLPLHGVHLEQGELLGFAVLDPEDDPARRR
jgi:hypothetical protein